MLDDGSAVSSQLRTCVETLPTPISHYNRHAKHRNHFKILISYSYEARKQGESLYFDRASIFFIWYESIYYISFHFHKLANRPGNSRLASPGYTLYNISFSDQIIMKVIIHERTLDFKFMRNDIHTTKICRAV